MLFSGYHKIHFETADRQRFGSEYPATFLRWELQPTVGLYGVPLSMNLLYTTEDNDPGGNAGRFQFGLSLSTDQLENTIRGRIQREMNTSMQQLMEHDPTTAIDSEISEIEGRMDELADLQANLDVTSGRLDQLQNLGLLSPAERFAMRFPVLGIGASYPQYSKYVMQGITVTGVHVEFSPGRAYLGTNIGNVRSPGGRAGFSRFGVFENERRVYAGRLGYGRPFGRHFHLMGVFVEESRMQETLNGSIGDGLPQAKNFIPGMKFRFGALGDMLDVQGELAGSFITRDTDAPELDDPNLGNIPLVSSLIDPNISSSADGAGMVEATLRLASSGTRFRSGLHYVGPGYVNLAVPSLRNDLREIMGGIEQSFYRRQMTLAANIRTERNNLNDLKNYTRTSTRYDLQLSLNFRDLPWLRLQYIPVIQKNKASDPVAAAAGEYTYNTTVINAISGYSVPIGNVISTTSVNISSQKSTTDLQSADASALTFGLNQNVGFGRAGVNAGYQRFSFTRLDDTLVRHDLTLGGSVRVLGMWLHEAGLRNSSGENQVRVTGLWYRSSIPIRYIGTLEVMIENTQFNNPALTDGSFAQTRFSTILTRSW
ncbi:MAG: hypothetical protein EA364_12025 [Balneolaceae bacterium]|nr:MAG: hypothetical protein EA364_12025 [Balneolaceae bacterium]